LFEYRRDTLPSIIYLPAVLAAQTTVFPVFATIRLQHSSPYHFDDELSNLLEDNDFLYRLKEYQLLKLDGISLY
jgi:hypothetical protein